MHRAKTLVALAVLIGLIGTVVPASAADSGPTDYRYRNDPFIRSEPQQVGTVKKLVPGVIGALVGGFFGGQFGMIGRIVGAAAGWFVGNYVGKLLFPDRWYCDYDNYPWYYQQQQRYQVKDGFAVPLSPPTYAPQAPQILDSKLASLREAYYRALAEYQKVLGSGTEAQKLVAKTAYEQAYQVYNEAKKSSLGN